MKRLQMGKEQYLYLPYQQQEWIIIKNNLKNKFLIIKAKYDVIEPHYIEGTTPDGPVVFRGSSTLYP
ncbi:MAG: hypothetical protein ACXWE7_13640 [Nitrososphaeraceae archaeon]